MERLGLCALLASNEDTQPSIVSQTDTQAAHKRGSGFKVMHKMVC